MSQADALLEVLLRGETVTPLSGYALCGSLAVHSRIAQLRAQGYQISCRIVTRNGKRYGEYKLDPKAPKGQGEMFLDSLMQ